MVTTVSTTSGVGHLDGINETIGRAAVWSAGVVRQEQAAAEKKAQQARDSQRAATRSTTTRSNVTVTGSCAEMKPAGFPDYIIQRESGGNPNAVNSNGGARGCAQIMPSHFGHWSDGSPGTCLGLNYKDCWAKIYAQQGLTPWACTPESGCG